jgi:hypothetical protein
MRVGLHDECCFTPSWPTLLTRGADGSRVHPRKSDFDIGIKILEKKCFGSAGCSVTYRIKPRYVGTQELN